MFSAKERKQSIGISNLFNLVVVCAAEVETGPKLLAKEHADDGPKPSHVPWLVEHERARKSQTQNRHKAECRYLFVNLRCLAEPKIIPKSKPLERIANYHTTNLHLDVLTQSVQKEKVASNHRQRIFSNEFRSKYLDSIVWPQHNYELAFGAAIFQDLEESRENAKLLCSKFIDPFRMCVIKLLQIDRGLKCFFHVILPAPQEANQVSVSHIGKAVGFWQRGNLVPELLERLQPHLRSLAQFLPCNRPQGLWDFQRICHPRFF
jgi:hypothetical protein